MKALIALLAFAAVVAGIYFFYVKDSAPYVTYKTFASAVANGERERALRYADNEDVLGGPEENRGQNAGGMPVDALIGIGYLRESETKNPDGTVTVKAIQSVRFDPPGTTSAMGAMTARYRQTVILHKSADHWLVSSMKSELIETRNWKGEKE